VTTALDTTAGRAAPQLAGHPDARTQALLQAPLLPTLLRLATPNVLGLLATTVVIGYDGYIVGRLGPDALAGVALVLPLSMLMTQMSAGGVGAAVAGAVARALGAGQRERADTLAQQALWVAAGGAALFALLALGFGATLFGLLGGRDAALQQALAYSRVLFGGGLAVWCANVLAGVARGGGRMVLASSMLVGIAALHLGLSPLLVFGVGSWPGLGIAGAAWSLLAANALAACVLAWQLVRGPGPVRLRRQGWRPQAAALHGLLRVALPASLSPLLSNGSVAIATAWIGGFGTAALAGFGLAARLEFIIVPIAFGFGAALTTLVATNLGAGQHQRALRVTWVGSGFVLLLTGGIGVTAALWPMLWMQRFASDPAVLAFGASYLRVVGACYGFFGFGLTLFFASQGAGRLFWPLVGSTSRLVMVAVGGWVAMRVFEAGPSAMFAVVACAFASYAAVIATAVALGAWRRP